MPGTRKDYTSNFNGTLASLQEATRLIYLLTLRYKAHEDNEYCLKDQFFHSIKWFADESGYSERTVINAFNDLKKLNIIEAEERPGRSTLYTVKVFIPPHKNQRIRFTTDMNQIHTTPESDSPITTIDLTTIDLTTTHKWLKDSLLTKAIRLHGQEWADVVVNRISRMNGHIRDKGAYFNWCIKTHIIPNSEELRAKEANEKHKKYLDEQIEKSRKEQEEREKAWAESDPEAGKKALAEFMSKISGAGKK